MCMGKIMERYTSLFPGNKNYLWETVLDNIENITEIRIRAEKPILIYMKQKEVSIDSGGNLIYVPKRGKIFSYREIQQLLDFWCQDSRYAFQNEMKRGFLTIEGGHRIGICGEVVDDEGGNVQSIKYISAVNIRVAHEIKGVADNIMKYIYRENQIKNTLLVSAPGAGKTTLLRDIIRQLSDGTDNNMGVNVGLVDERGEIAACFQGIPQLDVGTRTDILDHCKKAVGMRMLLRTMAPAVIAVDELGNPEEIELIQQMSGNGCAVIATIHGNSIEEIKQKKMLKEIWEQKVFKNIIYLFRNKNNFCVELYCDGEEKICYSC